jgi:hypothetical protein
MDGQLRKQFLDHPGLLVYKPLSLLFINQTGLQSKNLADRGYIPPRQRLSPSKHNEEDFLGVDSHESQNP